MASATIRSENPTGSEQPGSVVAGHEGESRPDLVASDFGEEMIYAVSHDLRGPLLNFQGFLRRLRKGCEFLRSQAEQWSLTAEQRGLWDETLEQRVWTSLEVLEQNGRRMERLLGSLLELSRAGREPPQFQRVATGELVRSLIEQMRSTGADKNAAFEVGNIPDLWADQARMESILTHLLNNTLKFLSPDRAGAIRVAGSVEDGRVTCWVEDNGIGIKPQDQQRIFLPFGRVREVDAPGEGVGLATVRKLVQQQGGRVWVESTHGRGSTFYICFPAAPAA